MRQRPAPRTKPTRARRGPGRPPAASGEQGRSSLLAAARELLIERGLPRVTLRAVAERAGVQPALVAYHFGNKQGLLRAVSDEISTRMLERVQQTVREAGSAPERLAQLLRSSIELLTSDPYAPRLIVEQILFGDEKVIDDFVVRFARQNLEAIQALLDEGQAQGVFRSADAMLLAPALFGSSLFLFLGEPVLKRLYGVAGIDASLAERFTAQQIDLLLNGLLCSGSAPGESA